MSATPAWGGLEKLAKLRDLTLHGSHVSDAGLAKIAKLALLEELNLEYTDVSGAGLMQLKSLLHLNQLYLAGCDKLNVTDKVTDNGLKNLQFVLPNSCIVHQQNDFSPSKGNHRAPSRDGWHGRHGRRRGNVLEASPLPLGEGSGVRALRRTATKAERG